MNHDLPIEIRVKRDAMMFYVRHLLENSTDPNNDPELKAATTVLEDINDSIDTIRRQRAQSAA